MSEQNKLNQHFNLSNLIAFLLLLGIASWVPYSYYTSLKVVVCSGTAFMLLRGWKKLENSPRAILIIICLLYNPVFPISIPQSYWIAADLFSAILVYLIGAAIEEK